MDAEPTIPDAAVREFNIAEHAHSRRHKPGDDSDCCVRAGLVAAYPHLLARTCQDNGEPMIFHVVGDHLHECGREFGHRSRVHRCACGAEWWIIPDPTTELR